MESPDTSQITRPPTAPETQPSGAKRGAFLGVLDQGISSLTNVAASIAAALVLSSEEFGAFAIAYLVYSIIVPGIQSIVGDELVLSEGTPEERQAKARDALLFAFLLGLACSACLAVVSAFIPSVRGPLLVVAICLPLLQLQDTTRYVAAFLNRMQWAVFADITWLALAAAGLALALTSDFTMTPTTFAIIWAGSGVLSTVFSLRFLVAPHLRKPQLSRFAHRSYLGYRFAWEYIAVRASAQICYVALGALAGLEAAGGLRGAMTLFGPLTIIIVASASFGVPMLRSVPAHRREQAIVAASTLLPALCIGAIIAVFLTPDSIGVRLLGETWSGAQHYSLAVGVQTAFSSSAVLFYVALRLIAPKSTLRLKVISAVMLPCMFLAGFYLAGPVGGVWAIAGSSAIQAVIGVAAYLRLRSQGLTLADLK